VCSAVFINWAIRRRKGAKSGGGSVARNQRVALLGGGSISSEARRALLVIISRRENGAINAHVWQARKHENGGNGVTLQRRA